MQQGGPAAAAGILEGDVIVKVGDRPIAGADELVVAVRERNPGDTVPVDIVREGRPLTAQRGPGLRLSAVGWTGAVFDSIGWGEILVLIVAGLFILGPERLPSAAAWVGRSVRQVKEYATGAREQLRGEFGSEFDELRKPLEELRSLRDLNPRTAVQRTLFEDDPPTPKPTAHPART